MGGASLFTFVLFIVTDYTDRSEAIWKSAAYLSWVINWPHFSMTCNRLYESKNSRQQYPFTSYLIPPLIIFGTIFAFSAPTEVAPYWVKLFLLWSPYHFAGQTVGLTLVYARRAGVLVTPNARRCLSAFVFGTAIISMLRAEISRNGNEYYGIKYPGFGVPEWIVSASEVGMWLSGALFLVLMILWASKNKKSVPVVVYLLPLTQYLWFFQAVYVPSFQEFVPLFHSLQYILIAWVMRLSVVSESTSYVKSRGSAFRATASWYSLNFVGGAGLFWFLPIVGTWSGATLLFSSGVVLASIQIHHFFVDGVIWKLKRTTVQHPLMTTSNDFTSQQ